MGSAKNRHKCPYSLGSDRRPRWL